MWQAGKEEPDYDPGRPVTRPLFPERADVVVHDERGRVSCVCPETGEERALAFQSFEAGRGACGTPTPWGSLSWWRGYRRRSAMERINSRIDRGFGFETHYTRGLAKMKTRIGLALAVMMALAPGQVRAGHAERMRTLVGAVPLRDTG